MAIDAVVIQFRAGVVVFTDGNNFHGLLCTPRFAEALKNNPDASVVVFRSDAPVTKEIMPIFKKDIILIQTGGILNEELFNSGRISAYISKKDDVDLLKLSSDPAKAFAEGYTVRTSN